jgi:hypothetical protein
MHAENTIPRLDSLLFLPKTIYKNILFWIDHPNRIQQGMDGLMLFIFKYSLRCDLN